MRTMASGEEVGAEGVAGTWWKEAMGGEGGRRNNCNDLSNKDLLNLKSIFH